jgi:hypothetical protein
MVRAQEVLQVDGTTARRKPVVGDYTWDGEVWRRWSGRRWATAAYSLHPERLAQATRPDEYAAISKEGGRRILAKAVEDQVATNGATVVFDGPSGVVLGYRRRYSTVFHALMTVFTAGLWALFWIAAVLTRHEDRVRFEVDTWGNVWAVPVAAA